MAEAIHSTVRVLGDECSVRSCEQGSRLRIADGFECKLVSLRDAGRDRGLGLTVGEGAEPCGPGHGPIVFGLFTGNAEHPRLTSAADTARAGRSVPSGEVITCFAAGRAAIRTRENAADGIGKPGGDRARQPKQGGNGWTGLTEGA